MGKKGDSLHKPKGGVRKHKAKHRHKSKKRSFLGAIWDYFKSDSFMYGPLLSKKWNTPGVKSVSGTDRGTRAKSRSPVRILKDFMSTHEGIMKRQEEPIRKVIHRLEEARDAGGKVVQGAYVKVHKTITKTTVLADRGDKGGDQQNGSPETPSKSVDVRRGETELTGETPKSVDRGENEDLMAETPSKPVNVNGEVEELMAEIPSKLLNVIGETEELMSEIPSKLLDVVRKTQELMSETPSKLLDIREQTEELMAETETPSKFVDVREEAEELMSEIPSKLLDVVGETEELMSEIPSKLLDVVRETAEELMSEAPSKLLDIRADTEELMAETPSILVNIRVETEELEETPSKLLGVREEADELMAESETPAKFVVVIEEEEELVAETETPAKFVDVREETEELMAEMETPSKLVDINEEPEETEEVMVETETLSKLVVIRGEAEETEELVVETETPAKLVDIREEPEKTEEVMPETPFKSVDINEESEEVMAETETPSKSLDVIEETEEEMETPSKSVNVRGKKQELMADTPSSVSFRAETEQTAEEAEVDDENSWANDGHEDESDFHDSVQLDEAAAEKVANQLIGGLGGRYSDDLGINVNLSDNEVECWFLAANLFGRNVSVDVAQRTYKELAEVGVSMAGDLLTVEDGTVAAILQRTGYTKYGRRVASQLKKLATHLEENYWGRVSTFKHTTDNQDLIRHLRSLPGVKLSAARTFLRELRGVWSGAPVEFDQKSKRAAMHLKLLGSIRTSSRPDKVLSEFAESKGIDNRDLEVALFKLGSEHEQQYGKCPGGAECKALVPAATLIQLLPSDILL